LTLSARLSNRVTLEARAGGEIAARFEGYAVGLGKFSAGTAERAQKLRTGLPLAAFASAARASDKEIELLIRRLARRGLLEYRLGGARDREDLLVIEPQAADYWPQTPPLDNADTLALSRFAYMRRRGDELVLESPRSGALFRVCDPTIASFIATLANPRQVKALRRQAGFPGIALLALLVDCRIVFKLDAAGDDGPRLAEGDHNLVLWDFHDLLFHTRSTEGRHANPLGGVYPYAGAIAPLPAVRPRWPGKKIDLDKIDLGKAADVAPPPNSPVAMLLRQRHSTRSFDDQHPITLAELAQFLDGAARVLATVKDAAGPEEGIPADTHTARPYPSAGASHELELYLTVNACEGLARGFYHYDAGGHALMLIEATPQALDALLAGAQFAMGAAAPPQILVTIAARFGRVSWKYSSLAYALILKDVGVLTQTLYLMATDLELGGCAIGIANIDLFAKMTGIEFHVEGPVGHFALGRGSTRSINPTA
jgi:SagB-type dehydrogenase family enzyme